MKKQEKMKAAEQQAALAETCRRAKERLAVLESRPGSRIKITEEERQTRLAEAQKQIADSCGE